MGWLYFLHTWAYIFFYFSIYNEYRVTNTLRNKMQYFKFNEISWVWIHTPKSSNECLKMLLGLTHRIPTQYESCFIQITYDLKQRKFYRKLPFLTSALWGNLASELRLVTLANSLLRTISISSCVRLSYRWGCWWFHMWLNHMKLPAFSETQVTCIARTSRCHLYAALPPPPAKKKQMPPPLQISVMYLENNHEII